jgi:hypothetical protein
MKISFALLSRSSLTSLTIICLTIFSCALSVSGQTTEGTHLYLSAGADYPFGSLGDRSTYGLNASLGLGIVPSKASPEVEMILRPGYFLFPARSDYVRSFRFLTMGLDLRLRLSSSRRSGAYLLLGGGLAHTWLLKPKLLPPGSFAADQTENNPYISPGAGFEIVTRNRLNYYIELRFYDISGNSIGDYRFMIFAIGLRT